MKTLKWILLTICIAIFTFQISVFASDTDALVILENGNIGIGVTEPSENLHVKDGRIRVERNSLEQFGLIFIQKPTCQIFPLL
jgi:hypothetical protein